MIPTTKLGRRLTGVFDGQKSTRNFLMFVDTAAIACHQNPEALVDSMPICNSSRVHKRQKNTSRASRLGLQKITCEFIAQFSRWYEYHTDTVKTVVQVHTKCKSIGKKHLENARSIKNLRAGVGAFSQYFCIWRVEGGSSDDRRMFGVMVANLACGAHKT